MLKTRGAPSSSMEEAGGKQIYQDKNTIVEITVHTKPKRVSPSVLYLQWLSYIGVCCPFIYSTGFKPSNHCLFAVAVFRISITLIRIPYRILLFNLMKIRVLPFTLMWNCIRILLFNLMRIPIRFLPLTYSQIWTLQCSKMAL